MRRLSNTEYQELRNKIWADLVSSGVASDEDENYTAFDNVLGSHLPVDFDWDETRGSDICYKCGTAQDYGTMKDVVEDDFAIYCDNCHPVAKAVKTLEGLSDILETDLSVDWEMTDPTIEFKLIGKLVKKVKEDLESTN